MAVISDDYKKQLNEVHTGRRPDKKWGTTGARNIGDEVVKYLEHRRGWIKTVLDFGAGQCSLEKYVKDKAVDVRVNWTNYDPGIPELSALPEGKFDLICSSDVMEHVEPEMVDETIQWQKDHAERGLLIMIACSECGLKLPDGRNAHLTVQEPKWWWDKYECDQWQIIFAADCVQMRRGNLAPHAIIMLEKRGS